MCIYIIEFCFSLCSGEVLLVLKKVCLLAAEQTAKTSMPDASGLHKRVISAEFYTGIFPDFFSKIFLFPKFLSNNIFKPLKLEASCDDLHGGKNLLHK